MSIGWEIDQRAGEWKTGIRILQEKRIGIVFEKGHLLSSC